MRRRTPGSRPALALVLAIAAGLCACTPEPAQPAGKPVPAQALPSEPPAQPASPAGPPPSAERPPSAPAPSEAVVARVRAVDLRGAPVADIVPIASGQPNAFDEPAAVGPPTDADGRSTLAIPADRWMYVRGWDPALRRFANNIYDITPGEGQITDELTLVMVDAAALQMTLFRADGAPVAGEAVGLMMMHPERGPWWPAEAETDSDGVARFAQVPPGAYLLRIKAAESGMIELPTITLAPNEMKDLGSVGLLPQ